VSVSPDATPADGGRRLALVTGASSGIGEAFAVALAERGFDVALTARRADRLSALAATLGEVHGVQTLVIPADLADPRAPAEVVERIAGAGRVVDVLVNNAGYALGGTYRRVPWERQRDLLQVLLVAVCDITHRCLPGMIDRGYGRIVNVSSLMGLTPGLPGSALYGASKSFLVRFSQSLATEVRQHGVYVTAVCPGFTRSEFHDLAGSHRALGRLPRPFWTDARTVARLGLEAAMAGRGIYVNGWVNRTLRAAAWLVPDAVTLSVLRRVVGRAAVNRR
jgi:uncharacterized protein